MALISKFRKKLKEADDLGFGTKITGESYRLMEKNGKYNVQTIGKRPALILPDF